MEVKRGDLMLCIPPGDFGKPRPAVIVQADMFNARDSITVCLLTGELITAPLFRVRVKPGPSNALRKVSDVMVDKIMTLRKERFYTALGRLTAEQMRELDAALHVWLGLPHDMAGRR